MGKERLSSCRFCQWSCQFDNYCTEIISYCWFEFILSNKIIVYISVFILAFDDYFQSLIPSKNTRNPWFLEYWEQTYRCKFRQTITTIFNQNYTRLCSG